ncbi:beta-ketoacyl synthase chain length factor, partial [Stenotrophomonas geniculata]
MSEVPAMLGRGFERLGRLAFLGGWWWVDGQGADSDVPLVFASRHGDVARSMDLLGALVGDQPLSPTGFGLSVHNAIAALYSIARGHRGNYLALAAGQATVET